MTACCRIGVDVGIVSEGTAAAFVAGGLLSVIVFPATSLALLKRKTKQPVGSTHALPAA